MIDIYNTNKKYKIIYADPPWTFKTYSNKGKGKSAEKHYPCMCKEDIQKLPIHNITDKDSVLFLWVTYPCLLEGLELIKAWGFTYKTCGFSWIKLNKKNNKPFVGMGYYTRSNNEICLLATKGKPLTRLSKSVKQVILSKIEEHSKKPSEIRDRIVELFGDIPRIELFARQQTDGWDCWGNDVNHFEKEGIAQ